VIEDTRSDQQDVYKMVPSALSFIAKDAAVWARPYIESLAEGKTPFTS
jgi:hypothetical protein